MTIGGSTVSQAWRIVGVQQPSEQATRQDLFSFIDPYIPLCFFNRNLMNFLNFSFWNFSDTVFWFLPVPRTNFTWERLLLFGGRQALRRNVAHRLQKLSIQELS